MSRGAPPVGPAIVANAARGAATLLHTLHPQRWQANRTRAGGGAPTHLSMPSEGIAVHNGGANCGCIDGHVAWMSAMVIYNGRAKYYNNPHQ